MTDQLRKIRRSDLVDLIENLDQLSDRAEGIIDSLRIATYLAPLARFTDLDQGKIKNFASELNSVIIQGQVIQRQIERLKSELGIQ